MRAYVFTGAEYIKRYSFIAYLVNLFKLFNEFSTFMLCENANIVNR